MAELLDEPRILSVRQPWAELIVRGIKDVENRGTPLSYRGRVLIHASKACPRRYVTETLEDLVADEMLDMSQRPAFERLRASAGHILGEVEIIGCVANPASSDWSAGDGWAWQLANARVLRRPIPFVGKLALLRCPAEVARTVASIGFEEGGAR